MLVLCSDGLTSEALLSGIRASAGRTAALVVTADPIYKEQNRHVPRCVAELQSLHLSVDLFDLDRQPASELLRYDTVEFIGGNPFYLLHAVRQRRAESVLRDIADRKLLIGWSAAAFVFGPTLELVNRYTPDMNTPGLTDLHALALTDVQVLPHYSRFLKRFDRFEETCLDYERAHQVTVLRLSDGEGCLIDGQAVTVCRK
ncbi:MAG: Type 1 glutamine amidotransferase-like domain-containing protein [Candidatus Ventricola sp.]